MGISSSSSSCLENIPSRWFTLRFLQAVAPTGPESAEIQGKLPNEKQGRGTWMGPGSQWSVSFVPRQPHCLAKMGPIRVPNNSLGKWSLEDHPGCSGGREPVHRGKGEFFQNESLLPLGKWGY